MAVQDIDFEGTDNQGQGSDTGTKPTNEGNNDDVTNLGGDDVEDVNDKGGGDPKDTTNDDSTNKDDDNLSTGELNTGDQVEVDGVTYTVAENGDIVDEKGNVFKEAKDVKEWLKSVSVEDENDDTITLNSIQEALDVTITDESGKPVEFTDDAAGVKSYVDSVIELRSKELQEAAINRLYSDNPLLKQFQDYVQLNGTARGFGDIPDRSKIQLDKDNKHQLIAVIKMAAQEFGNKSLNDNYIKYLDDSGSLYDEAKSQLEALVDKDKNYRKEIERQAADKENKKLKILKNIGKKLIMLLTVV